MTRDDEINDKVLRAMLEAPVTIGWHVTQFQFVIADGIARRAPWLTAREIVRETNTVVRVALEYAMGVYPDNSEETSTA